MRLITTFLLTIALCSNLFGQTANSFVFAGNTREYLLYVPAVYTQTNQSVPLVVVLHGLGDNMQNMSMVGFHQIADTANFIVATPQALPDPILPFFGAAWHSGASMFGVTPNAALDDVGFLSALVDSISANYSIDPNRIYFTGFSMGGYMSNRMACERSDKVAAIASVAGTIGNSLTCDPELPVATAHFHGTTDAVVPYSSNTSGIDAEEVVAFWRNHNQCDATPLHVNLPNTNLGDGYTVEHFTYPNGDSNTEVQFFKTNGADHTWLGPNNDIYYTEEIWKFLSSHSKSLSDAAENLAAPTFAWNAYPNPASDKLYVQYPAQITEARLTLSDVSGRALQQYTLTDKSGMAEISLNDVPAGIYLLSLATDQGMSVKKITVK